MTERCNVVGQQLPIPISAGDWRIVPFHEFVFFQEGPGIRHWQYRDEGIPFINIRCLVDGRLDVSSMNCIDPIEVDEKYQHFLLDAGDYVVSSSGTIGRLAEVSEDDLPCMLNTSVIRMRPRDERLLHRRFLRYFLTSSLFQDQIRAVASGSVQLNYGPTHLKQLWLCVPPLPEQRAIAHVLGTLDDKIELNRRMNETLEAMARVLFKSWFVDFDPVRAKMDGRWRRGESLPGLPANLYDLFPDCLMDSDLGEIPKGWEVKALGDVTDVVGGTTPSTKVTEYWEKGTHCWATPKDLSVLSSPVLLDTERKITDAGLRQIGSGLLPTGTLLLSSRAPIGYLAVSEEPVAINQGFIAMPPCKGTSNLFMLHWCGVFHDEIVNYANGSTFLEISKSNFRSIPLVVPAEAVMTAFDKLARTLYERMVSNERESRSLTAQRDVLLPKLLSREVGVKEKC